MNRSQAYFVLGLVWAFSPGLAATLKVLGYQGASEVMFKLWIGAFLTAVVVGLLTVVVQVYRELGKIR